jgi:hypothetical protein
MITHAACWLDERITPVQATKVGPTCRHHVWLTASSTFHTHRPRSHNLICSSARAAGGIAALAGSHWELRVADVTVELETSSCHTDGAWGGAAGGSAFRIVFFCESKVAVAY